MVLFQTVRHQDPSEIFIVFLRVAAVPGLLVLIYDDPGTRAEFSCQVHPHVAFTPGRPSVMDHFQRRFVTLVYMRFQLPSFHLLIDRQEVSLRCPHRPVRHRLLRQVQAVRLEIPRDTVQRIAVDIFGIQHRCLQRRGRNAPTE